MVHFEKKLPECFGGIKILPTFASANERYASSIASQEFFLK